jgi:hypothetical protein
VTGIRDRDGKLALVDNQDIERLLVDDTGRIVTPSWDSNGGSRTPVITSPLPFNAGTNNGPTVNYTIHGYDATDARVLAVDTGNGQLKQSSNFGAAWSTDKTLPADLSWFNVGPILRFGGNLYMVGLATSTSKLSVWRAAPASGNTAFSWTLVHTMNTGANALVGGQGCAFATDGTYLFVGEYGDPTGGPQLYRTTDGTTWTTVLTKATWRHIHDVAINPLVPGQVWVAGGDGVSDPILYSNSNGDSGTYTAVPQISGRTPQITQMGFVPGYMVGLGDSEFASVVAVDVSTHEWVIGSPNTVAALQVPSKWGGAIWDPPSVAAGATTSTTVTVPLLPAIATTPFLAYFSNALPAGVTLSAAVTAANTVTVTLFNGTAAPVDLASGTLRVCSVNPGIQDSPYWVVVDPVTYVIYWITPTSTGGQGIASLFAQLRIGDVPVLIDSWLIAPGLMYVLNGQIWYGGYHRPRLNYEIKTLTYG